MHAIFAIKALKDNYVWVLPGANGNQAFIVDPGEAAPVHAGLAAAGLRLGGIIITHHHWDHTNGIKELLAERPVPVVGPADERIAGVTHPVRDGDEVRLPGLPAPLTVLEIPGHTRSHVAFVGGGILFCGDTLFAGGCGRIFEGTPVQMYRSLQRLAALPGETRVYCGHEYTEANLRFAAQVEPDNDALRERLARAAEQRARGDVTLPSTIAQERATNPFLRAEQRSVTESAERHAGVRLTSPTDIFAAVRAWKDAA
jgi:hydroxyacylglutathione hydrolase